MSECNHTTGTLSNKLREAIADGEISIVREILDSYPDLLNNAITDGRYTPLMEAVSSMERTPELVDFLLGLGPDVNARTKEGYTALHCCIDVNGEANFDGKPTKIIQLLVDAGADLEAEQHWGWTPLMQAVVEGTAEEVQALCDAGARLDCIFPEHTLPECKRGDTLLMASVYNPEIVRILIKAGANPHQKGMYGENAFEHAARELQKVSNAEHKKQHEELLRRMEAEDEARLQEFTAKIRGLGIDCESLLERPKMPRIDFEKKLSLTLKILSGIED